MHRLRQHARNVIYELRARLSALPNRVQYDVPYLCQFATPESAEKSLRKELAPEQDPDWNKTGASSPERYAAWAFTMCGMASAGMALGFFNGVQARPAELAEDALRHGVYLEDPDEISSMRYREFAKWIQKYGLRAQVLSRLSVRGVQYALSRSMLPMVSVNPNIRGYDTAPHSQKGGHLVLVTGYDLERGTVSINNPSGFVSTATQINHQLPVTEFSRYFAGRGVLLSK